MKKTACLLLMLCLGACVLCGCDRDRTASEAVSDVDIDLSALNTNIQVGASSEDIRLTGGYHVAESALVDGRTRGFCAVARVEGI